MALDYLRMAHDKINKAVVKLRMLHAHGNKCGYIHTELFIIENNRILLDDSARFEFFNALDNR